MSIKSVDFQGTYSISLNEAKKNQNFQNKGQEVSHFLSSQQRVENEIKKVKIQQSEKAEKKNIKNKNEQENFNDKNKKRKNSETEKVKLTNKTKGQHVDILI